MAQSISSAISGSIGGIGGSIFGGIAGGFLSGIFGGGGIFGKKRERSGSSESDSIFVHVTNKDELATALVNAVKSVLGARGAGGINDINSQLAAQAARIGV